MDGDGTLPFAGERNKRCVRVCVCVYVCTVQIKGKVEDGKVIVLNLLFGKE